MMPVAMQSNETDKLPLVSPANSSEDPLKVGMISSDQLSPLIGQSVPMVSFTQLNANKRPGVSDMASGRGNSTYYLSCDPQPY